MKPKMMRVPNEIEDYEQQIRDHVDHHVPIKCQLRFHPRRRPAIYEVIHVPRFQHVDLAMTSAKSLGAKFRRACSTISTNAPLEFPGSLCRPCHNARCR